MQYYYMTADLQKTLHERRRNESLRAVFCRIGACLDLCKYAVSCMKSNFPTIKIIGEWSYVRR